METADLSLQGLASLLFMAAGSQLTANVLIGVGLVVLAAAVLVLKAWLAKQGIAAKGQ
jgi:hypothetical protein